ncbi:glycine--tRNA ligase subunit beta [Bacillus sp. FJAT-42376]|uniref:glycine--tRNA ligase subunit beta n=1 Tax=Bacillus sp. FJAT-42376 TaxID=2014076 RepID=UPI000F4F0B29|nr:glycine--tRNA ligase subunit beta [Bacillus sp. FJAT-42376]AZB43661.1 glycine--tRNA ligase subunit beta [Bacillus sp. FJAT-42376]
MAKRDLLLEIGLEELPARFVTESMNQLGEKMQKWLNDHKIPFGAVRLYSTPRRLAVFVSDLAEKQEDVTEEAKGPAKKIALDAEGNWSKAAAGFCRGQGASEEDIYFKEINGVEYVHVQKHVKGQFTMELLKSLDKVISSMTFPKNMRWGSQEMRYARPIKSIVALFGSEVIPFQLAGVHTGSVISGHRFLGESEVSITEPAEYEQSLKEQFVIADPAVRKQMIRSQLDDIARKNSWTIPVDETLLEEVNNLVEYPTALYGKFEEEYLTLPEEVLVTTMKEHQRYFPVKNEEGVLLSYFITVRNGNDVHLENVARGNEKVLRARLSDAAFFYREDHKLQIGEALEKLEKIVFHEELGSLADKVRRVTALTEAIAKRLELSETVREDATRAARISKFDLVSHMVYEFPELQGIMGEKYAKLLGEKETVAAAINEHYSPRHSEDPAPPSEAGAAVAIADKLDTICAFFSIGMLPTGSQDPYALRRQASGIVQILLAHNWIIPLPELFQLSISVLGVSESEKLIEDLTGFFKMRAKYVMDERNVRYDVVEAILQSSNLEITSMIKRSEVLASESGAEGFKETIEAFSRVLNIAGKAEDDAAVSPDLFENDYEKALYEKADKTIERYRAAADSSEYSEAFAALKSMTPEITSYFDHTMVMAEDEKVKRNRLAQMKQLADVIRSFAEMNSILVK